MFRTHLMLSAIPMALFATDAAAATPAAPKVKTVLEDMDGRRFFATPDDAKAYLMASADAFSDFDKQTFANVGIDDEGNFDPEVYTDGMRVMVAVLKRQGKSPGEKTRVQAIVVAPAPTIESILADEAALAWATRILEKEINHVAVRAIRDVEDVSTTVDQMPRTLAAYISSARGEGGGIMETFNTLQKDLNATMSKINVWAKARLIKSDFKKALESKGYALEYFPALENHAKGSLFVMAAQIGVNAAKKKGLDATIFERWLETRDAKTFTPGEDEEDDLDLDSLTSSLLEETAPVEAPAAPIEAAPTA